MGDELLKVFVTSIIDPSMFWARIGCDVELESEPTLEDIISDYVSQVVQDRSKFEDIILAPNQIILAKSTEHGGRWLRATAVSCSSSQLTSEIDVVFTGYGSNELVGWRDIITAVPDFVCEWRKSAECFRLHGVEPIDDCWSTEAVEYFSNCVLKKRLLCGRVDGDRLVIYTSKGERETIQDCLIRKKFAKRSSDEEIVGTPLLIMNGHPPSVSTAAAAAAEAGGIPEFDTTGLFFGSNSPTLPLEDTLSPPRDFELELHKRFLDTSEGGLPTHSDDVYCGRRSANSSHLGSEQYATKARDIKDELAQISKANRQLVRSEGRQPANGRLRSNRSSTDPRNGFKASRISEKDEDDWRVPKVSRSLGSPNDEFGKRATNEQESFKEDLQNLRTHLNRNSSQDVILAFARQILQKDDLRHRNLLSCLTVIVDEMVNDDTLMVRCLDLLEALQSEKEFHKCLADVIAQIHVACIQIADFEFLKLRMMLFTELLAHLLLRFPEESLIIERALEIVDFWISSKIKSSDVQSVQKIYASCLKNFVCIVALHSVRLVRKNLFHLLNAVREMLISDVQPRSVREIWLDLLLYVEQKETENRMMSSKTMFGQIDNQSQTRHNGSMDCTDISSIIEPENTSLHSNVAAAAASPSLSSTSHSSFRSAGAASLNENHITPPGSRSSPFITGAASLSDGSPESLSNRNRSESAESRPSAQKPSKKKAQKKMSLQSFYASPSSPVAAETTPDRAIFRDDVNCVTCGSQYHATSDCPDRGSKFIL